MARLSEKQEQDLDPTVVSPVAIWPAAERIGTRWTCASGQRHEGDPAPPSSGQSAVSEFAFSPGALSVIQLHLAEMRADHDLFAKLQNLIRTCRVARPFRLAGRIRISCLGKLHPKRAYLLSHPAVGFRSRLEVED